MKLLSKALLGVSLWMAAAGGVWAASPEPVPPALAAAEGKTETAVNETAASHTADIPLPFLLEPGPVLPPVEKEHSWQHAIHASSLPAVDRIHSMTASIPMPDSVVADQDKGFIDASKLPKSMHYQPLSDFSAWKTDPMGQRSGILTVRKGKTAGAAFLYQVEMNNPSAAAVFHDLFDEKTIPAPAIQKLFFFNTALMRAEPILNDLFLEGADNARKAGIPVSYSFASIDFGDKIEQLHRMDEKPVMYTFAAWPRFLIDGFIYPIYSRGCLWKHDNSYRFLFIASLSNQEELFNDAIWTIIKEYR